MGGGAALEAQPCPSGRRVLAGAHDPARKTPGDLADGALGNSAVAQTPAVIGWIRPVVLLPASALSGLEPGQIEALLAHELAHIRRHDYLVNLLQTAVETLLFYHPAVWWVGRQMRAERENCCDDLAVAVCGDALVYARALTELEQIRIAAPRLAMAANDGSLLNRVRRLLES